MWFAHSFNGKITTNGSENCVAKRSREKNVCRAKVYQENPLASGNLWALLPRVWFVVSSSSIFVTFYFCAVVCFYHFSSCYSLTVRMWYIEDGARYLNSIFHINDLSFTELGNILTALLERSRLCKANLSQPKKRNQQKNLVTWSRGAFAKRKYSGGNLIAIIQINKHFERHIYFDFCKSCLCHEFEMFPREFIFHRIVDNYFGLSAPFLKRKLLTCANEYP